MAMVFMILMAAASMGLVYFVVYDWQSGSIRTKALIFIIFSALVGCVLFYSISRNNFDQKVIDFQRAFGRGDTVVCKMDGRDVYIDNSTFNYVNTNLSFIGKNDTHGYVIELDSCYKTVSKAPKEAETLNNELSSPDQSDKSGSYILKE